MLGAILLPSISAAIDVHVVAVTPGRSADVVIDGREPMTIEVGQTLDGVRVVSVASGSAVVTFDGGTKTLPLVADPGAGHATGGSSVSLAADGSGQFYATGAINGHPTRFMVDTGATLTAVSRSTADQIGIDYSRGRPALTRTASGVARGWLVSFASVTVGNVTIRNVDGFVLDGDALPMSLLGASFLNRFDMRREGSTLVLRRSAR